MILSRRAVLSFDRGGSAKFANEGKFITMKNQLKSLLVAVRPFNRQFSLVTVCEIMPLFQLSGACIFIIRLLLLLSTSCSFLASVLYAL